MRCFSAPRITPSGRCWNWTVVWFITIFKISNLTFHLVSIFDGSKKWIFKKHYFTSSSHPPGEILHNLNVWWDKTYEKNVPKLAWCRCKSSHCWHSYCNNDTMSHLLRKSTVRDIPLHRQMFGPDHMLWADCAFIVSRNSFNGCHKTLLSILVSCVGNESKKLMSKVHSRPTQNCTIPATYRMYRTNLIVHSVDCHCRRLCVSVATKHAVETTTQDDFWSRCCAKRCEGDVLDLDGQGLVASYGTDRYVPSLEQQRRVRDDNTIIFRSSPKLKLLFPTMNKRLNCSRDTELDAIQGCKNLSQTRRRTVQCRHSFIRPI